MLNDKSFIIKLGFGGVSNLLRPAAIDAILFLGGRREPEERRGD